MRRALVVGIDAYNGSVNDLHGCVSDAYAVKAVLERNSDGTKNFDVRIETSVDLRSHISRNELRQTADKLFKHKAEIALFYYAGHGYLDSLGGYLVTSDATTGNDGLSLFELIALANDSPAENKIIVLDSCFSGIAGNYPTHNEITSIAEGVTIITACTDNQYSAEESTGGVFTKLFIDALNGAGSNLLGEVSPGGVYSHIDQSLSAWEQRPVFKTNVHNFVCIRQTEESISLEDLQQIPALFPEPDHYHPMDPSYEPEMKGRDEGMAPPDPQKVARMKAMQRMNRVNLVQPVEVEHMWNAAMESKGCKLTVLGEHYFRLVSNGRL